MKLEDQVTSLELSKHLKELGVKQESLFYWYKNDEESSNSFVEYEQINYENIYRDYPDPVKICSAFTASELLELLPIYIEPEGTGKLYKLFLDKCYFDHKGRFLGYKIGDIPLVYRTGYDDLVILTNGSFENSLASTLIYLIENRLLEIK